MDQQRHKYENIHLTGDDHDESSTEVDESLMGDEKQWDGEHIQSLSKRQRRNRCLSALSSCRWIVDTLLLLVIIGLLVREQLRKLPVNPWDFTGDMTGVGPRFSQQITKFSPDQSYAPDNTSEFFRPEVLDKWNALMPKGMGFVWVNDTKKYHDLPTPIDWPDKTVFTTSLTHQLHCLYAMVQTYSGLASNTTVPDDHHWHMIHCFDYLRQSIMCCGDMALEGHETTSPKFMGGSDGWDAKHVCKDYNQVKGYLESVRAYDDQLIY